LNQPASTSLTGISGWQATGFTVSNNYIHDDGTYGVYCGDCTNAQILNNLIVNSDANGVTIDNQDGTGSGTTVSGNTVDGASDVGITSWGGNNIEVLNNVIRDITLNISPYGITGPNGQDSHVAMYTEQNSRGSLVFEGNYIQNVGCGYYSDSATGVQVESNTFNLASGTTVAGSDSGSGTFSGNTIYEPGGAVINLSSGWTIQNNTIITTTTSTTTPLSTTTTTIPSITSFLLIEQFLALETYRKFRPLI